MFSAYMYAAALRQPAIVYGYVSVSAFEAGVATVFARMCWPIAAWLPVAAAFHIAMLLGIKCVVHRVARRGAAR